jgi:putative transposase
LAKAQRRVARRKQGSARRTKAVVVLARAQQTVKRQQADVHHTTALRVVRQYDTIYCEAIQPVCEAIQPVTLSRRPAPIPDGHGG